MSKFTINLTSWRFGEGEVSTTSDTSDEKWFILEYPIAGGENEKHIHAIPLSGISFRMEVLSVRDQGEVLDIMLREINDPEIDAKPIYPEVVRSYYDASMRSAKAIVEDEESSKQGLRSVSGGPGLSEGDVIGEVRSILRGDTPTVMARTSQITPLSQVITDLGNSRSSTYSALNRSKESVTVEETNPMRDLRQALADLTEEINLSTDRHAHAAMEASGAYYYARKLRKGGS